MERLVGGRGRSGGNRGGRRRLRPKLLDLLLAQFVIDVVPEVLEDPCDRRPQRLAHTLPFQSDCLDQLGVADPEIIPHLVQTRDIRQVSLVRLIDDRDPVGIETVESKVRSKVLETLLVRCPHRLLRVRDEDDAVGATQHELAGGVVEDLSGYGVELDPHLLSADGAELHRHEVEEQRPVRLGRHRDHLALVPDLRVGIDVLEVRGLAAQPGTVVDELRGDLVRRLVDQYHRRTSCRRK